MYLTPNEPREPLHLSHLMNLVSAYEPSPKMCKALYDQLSEALEEAVVESRSVIVSQDTNEFFFLVHASGNISLCCRMRDFHLEDDQSPLKKVS